MMFGCSSFAEVRASRWKRSTNSLSNARENGSTLMATSRSSSFSFALKTIAMPPRPSSSRISYSASSSLRTMSISVTSCGSAARPTRRAAGHLEDLVLRVELLADHVDFGDFLRLGDSADGRRRGQIEAARVTELRSVLVLGATARAVHPVSEGAGPNLGFVGRPVNNLKAL